MKRIICLILIPVLLLTGCALGQNRQKESVSFYYLRNYSDSLGYDEFFSEGAVCREDREISGYRKDLDYLLNLYFQGPLDSELYSPFPVGCKIVGIGMGEQELTISMNLAMERLNEMDLTVACACLAMTCMDYADVNTVHIESREPDGKVQFTRSFTRDNLFLIDTDKPAPEATDGT